MPNRFEELEPKLIELGEVLDEPDTVGEPQDFLSHVKSLTRDIDSIAQSLTMADFDDEYEGEEESTTEDTEEELQIS